MIALLDTNIIIHREGFKGASQDIGLLFKWLERCHYQKCIHSITIEEIKKNPNKETVNTFLTKLDSYEQIEIPSPMDDSVAKISAEVDVNENDKNDSLLLNEVYSGRVDIFITEDKKIHHKAALLNVSDKVFTIESFLEKACAENPSLINYRVLNVKRVKFGELSLNDPFFDTLKNDYVGFDKWFLRKYDDMAYVTINESNKRLLSFLYLKIEKPSENYADIEPVFKPKKRLKVGTFKVISNGFRLGERFLKIIFENAVENDVDEIYVTAFNHDEEQRRLIDLLTQWGFTYWGVKGEEKVYVRSMKREFNLQEPKLSFPYFSKSRQAFITAIYPKYHTDLLPDSILKNESNMDYAEGLAHRDSLNKVYVSRAFGERPKHGDLLVFYRTGGLYQSVVTTICVVDEVKNDFHSVEDFKKYCKKISVFTDQELLDMWNYRSTKPFAVKFLYNYSFPRRINMQKLIDLGILRGVDDAPRGFRPITKNQLELILKETESDGRFIVD